MGGFGRCKGKLCILGLLTAIATAASAQTETAKLAPRVRIRDRATAVAVERAIDKARRRLESPKCRELLSDFTDAFGRPLQAILDEHQKTPDEYVVELLFYDGSSQIGCKTHARAVTAPGSRVVFVCPQEFSRTRMSRRGVGGYEFVVIHEMLHSLGLEEDPPSSSEINARVRARCGE